VVRPALLTPPNKPARVLEFFHQLLQIVTPIGSFADYPDLKNPLSFSLNHINSNSVNLSRKTTVPS